MKSSENRVKKLFEIEYPIIQAGMVWCSGWRLAAAVSNAGGLGLIGAGSMYPSVLEEHLIKTKAATPKPFGVNVPLLYPDIDQHMEIIVRHGVKIVFTSAGNPASWTGYLKERGITVVHVVSSVKFALKAQQAGVDAVVAEGFEAGGHNGREETTTLVLIPMVRDAVSIPVIAAGGIASGRAMLAAEALGAEGVQIGSRFAASEESSAHSNFKEAIVKAREGDTLLTMKQLTPVRLLRNDFFRQVIEAEQQGASAEEMKALLGRGRAKKGMFEGDLAEGELEIGQVAAAINTVKPAADILNEIWQEYLQAKQTICRD
ncbi:MAG: nitronate monooxygenase [Cyclobacteriaceae bacterium]|jgi:enoyl-[acyl-carrier protein] reductase II|nr:nitronate monooxygenase [Cyclobacteriaceae bacterium]